MLTSVPLGDRQPIGTARCCWMPALMAWHPFFGLIATSCFGGRPACSGFGTCIRVLATAVKQVTALKHHVRMEARVHWHQRCHHCAAPHGGLDSSDTTLYRSRGGVSRSAL